jgi:cytochrome c-type biogenesis protein CcmH
MKRVIICLLLLLPVNLEAQVAVDQEPLVFSSPQQQDRFNNLTEELRCLVCQNQNLADSDAPLAHDLKKEILDMMQQGQTDLQIKSFLTERYGDFVLYKPPMQGNTLFLWLAPGVLLIGGAAVLIISVKRRKKMLSNESGGDS